MGELRLARVPPRGRVRAARPSPMARTPCPPADCGPGHRGAARAVDPALLRAQLPRLLVPDLRGAPALVPGALQRPDLLLRAARRAGGAADALPRHHPP